MENIDHRTEPAIGHRAQRLLADRLGPAHTGLSAADVRTENRAGAGHDLLGTGGIFANFFSAESDGKDRPDRRKTLGQGGAGRVVSGSAGVFVPG